jgi:hypothetical protein
MLPPSLCELGRTGVLSARNRDHWNVGRSQIKARDLGGCHPFDCNMLVGVWVGRARRQRAHKGNHFNDHGAVVVEKAGQGLPDRDFAAEFLANFTNDGGGGIFPGLDLAAGKFPFERQVFVHRTLGEEDQSLVLNQSANNRYG